MVAMLRASFLLIGNRKKSPGQGTTEALISYLIHEVLPLKNSVTQSNKRLRLVGWRIRIGA